jgi:DNA polymerase-3 subunit gamma/tau
VAATDRQKALKLTRAVFDAGVDTSDFVAELLEHFRCLIVLKSDPEAVQLLELTEEEAAEYRKQVDFFEIGDLLRLVKIGIDLYDDLRRGIDHRLLLETAAVKMAEMESTVLLADVLGYLHGSGSGAAPGANNNSERDLFGSQKRASTPSGATAQPTPAALGSTSRTINIPTIQSGWENFLAVLKKSSPMLASQIRMAELRSIKDNRLQMFFPASGEASRQLVSKPEHLKVVEQALRECYKANLSVSYEIDSQKQDVAEDDNKTKIDPKELVERSPRLKSLVDKVDGQIIGIKKVEG